MKRSYDFKAARKRIEDLKWMYRRLARVQEEDCSWDWFLCREINELEAEIEEAHKKRAVKTA